MTINFVDIYDIFQDGKKDYEWFGTDECPWEDGHPYRGFWLAGWHWAKEHSDMPL